MNEHQKLEVGEKYLWIKVLGNIDLRAYPNKGKASDKHPDYKGEGVAVWVRKKKERCVQVEHV